MAFDLELYKRLQSYVKDTPSEMSLSMCRPIVWNVVSVLWLNIMFNFELYSRIFHHVTFLMIPNCTEWIGAISEMKWIMNQIASYLTANNRHKGIRRKSYAWCTTSSHPRNRYGCSAMTVWLWPTVELWAVCLVPSKLHVSTNTSQGRSFKTCISTLHKVHTEVVTKVQQILTSHLCEVL